MDDHIVWAGDFKRHHLMWDKETDDRLFTTRALEDAGKLIEMLADLDLKMALPKRQPTLEHMVTKSCSCLDNMWCTAEIFDLIIRCEVDASLQLPATDHFPIATDINLPQVHSKPTTSYNFRVADWEAFKENLDIQLLKIPALQSITME